VKPIERRPAVVEEMVWDNMKERVDIVAEDGRAEQADLLCCEVTRRRHTGRVAPTLVEKQYQYKRSISDLMDGRDQCAGPWDRRFGS
jgi:hypothetical protein